MILNTAPQNEAIVSNVGEIGEFRIRNSAKAFNILSSGLYANKIRAIIRELSCNAVDSHTAAGKADTPFDVHLPNQLEPWFAIRDYGTGLTHEQVTNIYTTYFESTKTDSNAFIGALGLGSKSPFSYTDNFTVTAIKDGVKGIYTAFINDQGVPSIALMTQEQTDEPSGVEVKFSVNELRDFSKFTDEARYVYTYFALRPVISGPTNFEFRNISYESRDIIPGVHQTDRNGSHGSRSIAIMGNICYPIEVPNAEASLGELRNLLSCGLEIHFAIGELDFQASREGLSYIPQTIEAIKNKLTALNAVLADKLAEEANAVANLWDRAVFLSKRKDNYLWSAAVVKYATTNPIPTFEPKSYGGLKTFKLKVDELASQYNIRVQGFIHRRGSSTMSSLSSGLEYGDKKADGHYETWHSWSVGVEEHCHFIINDTKTGAGQRAKFHYKNTKTDIHARSVFIIEPVDRQKRVLVDAFFKAISNPPTDRIFQASSLMEKPRAKGMGKNVTIMKLERRGGRGYRRSDEDMVWRDAGKADSFDANETHYYVPLVGFQMQSTKGYYDAKTFHSDVTSLPGLFKGEVYGVRKGDLAWVKLQKNWVNLEEHIEKTLNGKDLSSLLRSVVRSQIEDHNLFDMPKDVLALIDANSPYAKLLLKFKGVDKFSGNNYNLRNLFSKFAPTANLSPEALVNSYNQEFNEVSRRYPLLSKLSTYRSQASDIAEYVNLIDKSKGI
jgi:hypothetical protein